MIFNELQQAYPGQFQDGQLQTQQRRVKEWRSEKLDEKNELCKPLLNSRKEKVRVRLLPEATGISSCH